VQTLFGVESRLRRASAVSGRAARALQANRLPLQKFSSAMDPDARSPRILAAKLSEVNLPGPLPCPAFGI
jgi:hypothetical protein